jgi:NAD(P)-dependent dehydrogenase (short-subunit alcohol dehydrogenase family)
MLVIFERWGHLDGFIHCAAHATPLAPIGHVDPKDLDRAWAVNARATQRLITMFDPLLKSAKAGRAVHCHDIHTDAKFSGSYRASKLAALSFVQNWQAESTQTGPDISVFEPDPMATALRGRFHPGEDGAKLASTASQAERLVALLK